MSSPARPTATRWTIALALAISLAPAMAGAARAAAITSDGTLGTAVNQVGNAYTISAGTIKGSNLFHSFGLFNVPAGGSATFSGPGFINNVISRVTGGQPSRIEGLISTRAAMPDANFFLINPKGVVFTSGASLDVGGAFRVSTADNIQLADGAVFSAVPVPGEAALLTSSPPQAFGFLPLPSGSVQAPISIDGATLAVDPGQTLSLVGGDVNITGGVLRAPGGLVQIGSVASSGSALLNAPALDLGSFTSLGAVTLSGATLAAGSTTLPGGTVAIRSGRLVADGAIVTTNTRDLSNAPVGIDLGATESIVLQNGTIVQSVSFGAGDAGDISIATNGNLTVRDFSVVKSDAFGNGRSGSIDVQAGSVDLRDGAIQTASILSSAGDITIAASNNITASGPLAEISTVTFTTDDPAIFAGDISLTGKNIILGSEATIRSGGAGGLGQPGQTIRLTANDSVKISGLAGITMQAFEQNAGAVEISAKQLTLNAGYVNTSTLGTGNAAQVLVNARQVSLQNGAQLSSSSEGLVSGNGGNITINAPGAVTISGVGSANGVGNNKTFTGSRSSGIFSTTFGSGSGGSVDIKTGKLQILKGGIISADSNGTAADIGAPPGTAGSVSLAVGDLLRMDHGTITTGAAEAAGGDITVTHTGSMMHLTDSQIITSVNGGDGKGGNITIGAVLDPTTLKPLNANPFDFIILNNSGIHANAFKGAGGNINIFSDTFLSSLPIATAVTASSALSTPGTIDIQANIIDLSGDVSQLPEVPLQATELLRASCAARLAGGKSSSLVVAGRDGLPIEPGSLLSSPLYLGKETAIGSGSQSRFSLFGSSNERVSPGLGWDQFHLAKAGLGFGCS